MAKDPAFLFYPNDFTSGTRFMTDEQVGKYVRLLCAQFDTGHLKKSHMLNICKTYDEDIFSKFEQDSEGKYYNKRLELEALKRKNYSESRRNNRKNKNIICKTYDEHMENENRDIVINKNNKINNTATRSFESPPIIQMAGNDALSQQFDVFWSAYPRKVAKLNAIKAWKKIRLEEVEQILTALSIFKQSQEWLKDNGQFIPHPATWLNQRRFEDDFVNLSPKQSFDINSLSEE